MSCLADSNIFKYDSVKDVFFSKIRSEKINKIMTREEIYNLLTNTETS